MSVKPEPSRWERIKEYVGGSPITKIAADITIAGSTLAVFGIGWKLVLIVIEGIKTI